MKKIILIATFIIVSAASAFAIQPYAYTDCTSIKGMADSMKCHYNNLGIAADNIAAIKAQAVLADKADWQQICNERPPENVISVDTGGKEVIVEIDRDGNTIVKPTQQKKPAKK